jgi:hypothetical protein
MSTPPTAENSPTRSPECCTETEIEIETGSRSASLGGHGDDRNHDRDRFNSVSSANSTGSGNRTLVEELRSLRDENRQLKHEKSAWTGTKREIELDLAMADGEAQLAAQRIDALEIELRRSAPLSRITLCLVKRQTAGSRFTVIMVVNCHCSQPPRVWPTHHTRAMQAGIVGRDVELDTG